MSNEKMREEFERAYSGEYGTPVSVIKMLRSDLGYLDGCQHDRLNATWWAWQASRTALCVELPNRCARECLDSSESFVHLTYELDGNDPVPLVRIPDVISAIESTGVRTSIKAPL